MKRSITVFLAVLAVSFSAAAAHAVSLDWEGKKCVIVDGSFKVCKPDSEWDTQKTQDDSRPIKWVLHKEDVNPIIWLRYDQNVTGQTAHDYAKVLRGSLESRGVDVQKTKNLVIKGRNVSIIEGKNAGNDLKYLVGVWRNKAKGFALECTANPGDFEDYRDECMTAIESVKIVSELH